MSRWSILGALVFGATFGLFEFGSSLVTDSMATRGAVAASLFGAYSAFVIFGTAGKKRSLSVLAQTLLGVLFACAIAALFGAGAEAYTAAIVLGLVLGFTADLWAKHI